MEATKTTNFKIEKDFPVDVKTLYEAWTTEDALRKWWKPNGNILKSLVNDISEGGNVKYEFADEEDNIVFVIAGTYEEAKPEEKLVYTWNWDITHEPIRNADYKLSITFSSKDNGSHIAVVQEGFKDDEAVVPHKEGWESGLRDLGTYLSGEE